MDNQNLAKQVLEGNRRALAKAITLIESSTTENRQRAETLLQKLAPEAKEALRVGISGVPGVGKSTFIEALGKLLVDQGYKLAVLAVDPTSPLSGGSILGDRTRMEELSRHAQVFIRPSPTGGSLGGVARRTRETLIACEAAGFDAILVETVGVGQSEAVVASMVDVFLLLQMPGTGDELQGMKKGVLELADVLAVTKADGANSAPAREMKAQLERALALVHHSQSAIPKVLCCSATENTGIGDVWKAVEDFADQQKRCGRFAERRREQAVHWFREEAGRILEEVLRQRKKSRELWEETEEKVRNGALPASVAARQMIQSTLKDQT